MSDRLDLLVSAMLTAAARGRHDLVERLALLKGSKLAAHADPYRPKYSGNYYSKTRPSHSGYKEELHPRGKDGRWIPKHQLEAAKSDPAKAAELRAKVRPEDAQKLEHVLSGKHELPKFKGRRGDPKNRPTDRTWSPHRDLNRSPSQTKPKPSDAVAQELVDLFDDVGNASDKQIDGVKGKLRKLNVDELAHLAKLVGWDISHGKVTKPELVQDLAWHFHDERARAQEGDKHPEKAKHPYDLFHEAYAAAGMLPSEDLFPDGPANAEEQAAADLADNFLYDPDSVHPEDMGTLFQYLGKAHERSANQLDAQERIEQAEEDHARADGYTDELVAAARSRGEEAGRDQESHDAAGAVREGDSVGDGGGGVGAGEAVAGPALDPAEALNAASRALGLDPAKMGGEAEPFVGGETRPRYNPELLEVLAHGRRQAEARGERGKPGTVDTVLTEDLDVDPDRFQYKVEGIDRKSGVSDALKDQKTFNPELAGTVAVWKDPADGKTYVCADEETEILTANGWRRWDEILPDDVALTLNHQTGKSEWQPILGVSVYPACEREMLLMEGKSHSSLTTLNHRWPVLYMRGDCGKLSSAVRRWRTSENLTCWDSIILAAKCDTLPETPVYTDDLVQLVAWAWTEGSIGGKRGRHLSIHQSHEVNTENCKKIRRSLCGSFGEPKRHLREARISGSGRSYLAEPAWAEHWRGNGMATFSLTAEASSEILPHLDENKEVRPSFLVALTERQLRLFVQRSLDGDGWVSGAGRGTFVQKTLAGTKAFQMACALLGIRTSAHWVDQSDCYGVNQDGVPIIPTPGGCHYTTVSRDESPKTIRPIRRGRRSDSFRVERIIHHGPVWCPTTANSSWLARRNGTVYFTGNCNGHHRYELAKRTGHGKLNVIYLDAKDAKEARAKGALINIAEDKGTAIDAAKWMSDTGSTVDDLAAAGVSLKGKVAADAVHLSKLSDKIFRRVARGDIDANQAIAVGKHLDDHRRQEKLFGLLENRPDLSNRTVEEMARQMASAGSYTKSEQTLWGTEETDEDTFVQRAELAAHVRDTLTKERGHFAAVSSEGRASAIADAGNTLNVEENRKRAANAGETAGIYDTLVNRKGPISDALNEHAAKYAGAKTKREKEDAKRAAVEAVKSAIERERSGEVSDDARGAGGDGGGREEDAGDHAGGPSPAGAPDAGRGSPEPAGVGGERVAAADLPPVERRAAADRNLELRGRGVEAERPRIAGKPLEPPTSPSPAVPTRIAVDEPYLLGGGPGQSYNGENSHEELSGPVPQGELERENPALHAKFVAASDAYYRANYELNKTPRTKRTAEQKSALDQAAAGRAAVEKELDEWHAGRAAASPLATKEPAPSPPSTPPPPSGSVHLDRIRAAQAKRDAKTSPAAPASPPPAPPIQPTVAASPKSPAVPPSAPPPEPSVGGTVVPRTLADRIAARVQKNPGIAIGKLVQDYGPGAQAELAAMVKDGRLDQRGGQFHPGQGQPAAVSAPPSRPKFNPLMTAEDWGDENPDKPSPEEQVAAKPVKVEDALEAAQAAGELRSQQDTPEAREARIAEIQARMEKDPKLNPVRKRRKKKDAVAPPVAENEPEHDVHEHHEAAQRSHEKELADARAHSSPAEIGEAVSLGEAAGVSEAQGEADAEETPAVPAPGEVSRYPIATSAAGSVPSADSARSSPNTVTMAVHNNSGQLLGYLHEPHDGSRDGIRAAATRLTERAENEYGSEWSNIQSKTGATGDDGVPRLIVSPNRQHVADISTAEGKYIFGDTRYAPRRLTGPSPRALPPASEVSPVAALGGEPVGDSPASPADAAAKVKALARGFAQKAHAELSRIGDGPERYTPEFSKDEMVAQVTAAVGDSSPHDVLRALGINKKYAKDADALKAIHNYMLSVVGGAERGHA